MSGKTAIIFCRSLDKTQLFVQESSFKNCNELNHKHLNYIKNLKIYARHPCIDKFPMWDSNAALVCLSLCFCLKEIGSPEEFSHSSFASQHSPVKPPQMRQMPWVSTLSTIHSDWDSKLLVTLEGWPSSLITDLSLTSITPWTVWLQPPRGRLRKIFTRAVSTAKHHLRQAAQMPCLQQLVSERVFTLFQRMLGKTFVWTFSSFLFICIHKLQLFRLQLPLQSLSYLHTRINRFECRGVDANLPPWHVGRGLKIHLDPDYRKCFWNQ